MPCYDGPGYTHSIADCILCSIFHKAEKDGNLQEVINGLDYKLMGFGREMVTKWWNDHKALDALKLKERGRR